MNMVELVLSSFSTGFIMTKSGLVLWVLGHVSGQQWHQILQRRRRLLAAVVIRALTVTIVNVTLAPSGQGDRDFACATLGFTQFWSLLFLASGGNVTITGIILEVAFANVLPNAGLVPCTVVQVLLFSIPLSLPSSDS